MIFSSGQRLVMIGDSITDCGRARPVGQKDGLGSGYVSMVNAALAARHPECQVQVLNTGIGGNRVTDLQGRWDTDVMDLKPDWLSIMIGINDVWRQFDGIGMDQVDIVTFERILDELVTRTKPTLAGGLILMTPYFIEPRREDAMRAMMDDYTAVVKRLAEKHDAILADTQAAFDHYLDHRPAQSLCGDRVHPNATGHQIIADTFLGAVGGL